MPRFTRLFYLFPIFGALFNFHYFNANSTSDTFRSIWNKGVHVNSSNEIQCLFLDVVGPIHQVVQTNYYITITHCIVIYQRNLHKYNNSYSFNRRTDYLHGH